MNLRLNLKKKVLKSEFPFPNWNPITKISYIELDIIVIKLVIWYFSQDGESSMTSSVSSLNTSNSTSSWPSAANNSWTSCPPAGNNNSNTSLLVSYPLTPLSPVKECKEPRSPAKLSQKLSGDFYE